MLPLSPANERRRTSHVRILRGNAADGAVDALDMGSIEAFAASTPEAYRNPAELHEAQRRAAVEAGYEQGLQQAAEAVAAATNDANNRVRYALSALEQAITSFEEREAVAIQDIEEQVVQMAVDIATQILQRELSVASNPGLEAITRALQFTSVRERLTARLHPEDLETLGMSQVEIQGRVVSLLPDIQIERGGCVLELADASIDAQLSTALNQVKVALGLAPSADRFSPEHYLSDVPVTDETITYVKKLEREGYASPHSGTTEPEPPLS